MVEIVEIDSIINSPLSAQLPVFKYAIILHRKVEITDKDSTINCSLPPTLRPAKAVYSIVFVKQGDSFP